LRSTAWSTQAATIGDWHDDGFAHSAAVSTVVITGSLTDEHITVNYTRTRLNRPHGTHAFSETQPYFCV